MSTSTTASAPPIPSTADKPKPVTDRAAPPVPEKKKAVEVVLDVPDEKEEPEELVRLPEMEGADFKRTKLTPADAVFDYELAFSRTIGWITKDELKRLSSKRAAICGCGGAGGEHAVTLSRLGIQHFVIADLDEFGVENFNRQAGAFMSTVNLMKTDVTKRFILDINPQAEVRLFKNGVTLENLDDFLHGVDILVDSLDFFCLPMRRAIFTRCEELKIPIVTCAPIGMSTACLIFRPGSMSVEEYFRFEDKETLEEQLIQFLIGLSPAMTQVGYLVDPSKADFNARKGPSTPMAIKLGSGVACTNVLKILLGRGDVLCAPYGQQFDAYTNRLVTTWRPWGNRHPLQRIMFDIMVKVMLTKKNQSSSGPPSIVELLPWYVKLGVVLLILIVIGIIVLLVMTL